MGASCNHRNLHSSSLLPLLPFVYFVFLVCSVLRTSPLQECFDPLMDAKKTVVAKNSALFSMQRNFSFSCFSSSAQNHSSDSFCLKPVYRKLFLSLSVLFLKHSGAVYDLRLHHHWNNSTSFLTEP